MSRYLVPTLRTKPISSVSATITAAIATAVPMLSKRRPSTTTTAAASPIPPR